MQTDKRLIDANDAINTIKAKARNEVMALKSVLSIIESAPAYDAVPVVHGQWLDCENYNDIRQCSECGLIRNIYKQEGWSYCPNCGAKMDGGAEG